MGGFRVNGCGTADSFYLLKSLPGHTCRSCGKKDYALMEVKRKIHVLFIPTVPINTKYAVACPKCKNGFYISEEQKSYILRNDPSCVEVNAEGVTIHGIARQKSIEQAGDDYIMIDEDDSAQIKLCGCGAELSAQAVFCTKCGAKVSKDGVEQMLEPAIPEEEPILIDKNAEVQEQTLEQHQALRTCKCGASLSASALFCTRCGTKVGAAVECEVKQIEEQTTFINEPEIQAVTSRESNGNTGTDSHPTVYRRGKVCLDCGIRALPGKVTCSICGGKLE